MVTVLSTFLWHNSWPVVPLPDEVSQLEIQEDGEEVAVAVDEVVYEIEVEASGSGIPKPSFNHNYEAIEHEETVDIMNCNTPRRRI